MTLKEKLLTLGIINDNEYLNKYCELIEANRETKREKFKTQKHHIIPRSYYKYLDIKVDNTKNNLVELLNKDHVLAHYYLVKCAKAPWFYYSCLCAIAKMFNDFKRWNKEFNILEDELRFIEILEKQEHLIEESHRIRGNQLKGCIWINNSYKDLQIDKSNLQDYLSQGWQLGRLYQMSDETIEKIASKLRGTHHETSEETKRKIGEANKIALKGKKHSKERCERARIRSMGRTFYNNGVTNIFIKNDEQPPEGFVKGMIINHVDKEDWIKRVHKNRKPEDYNTTGGTIVINNGKNNKCVKPNELDNYLKQGWFKGKLPLGKLNWYNDGIRNTRAASCPDGFVEGRLLTNDVRKSLGNGSRNRKKQEINN